MYKDEYENRGFPFRDFLLKLILIIIFVFLLIWLLPKFISPTIDTNTKNNGNKTSEKVDLSPLTSQIFADNIERMKDAAISYYTDERLPQEVGESKKMTLSEMIEKKIIVELIDKNNKACDKEESYVKITKMDDEYLLKVNLKDSEKEDYILVHLGCYTYCESAVCERKETKVAVKASKPTTIVPIKGATSDEPTEDKKPTPEKEEPKDEQPEEKPEEKPKDPTDNPTPTPPSDDQEYLYEYEKTTGAEFSKWTSWSSWQKTNCNTPTLNCNDDSTSCIKKVQILKRKEKVGTYSKKYIKYRDVLEQTGTYTQKTCSKYNYVIINTTTYATTTTTTYTTRNTLSNKTSSGGWTYSGRARYSNPPRDTATTHYVFVGADYSYCEDTCSTLPYFFYDKYVYNGGMTSVASTKSTTTSSTTTSTDASCGGYVYKEVPLYGTITRSEIATRTEPLYGTVCYQSSKTRSVTSSGKTSKKWSTYNDKSLLDNGWYYTGNTKVK